LLWVNAMFNCVLNFEGLFTLEIAIGKLKET